MLRISTLPLLALPLVAACSESESTSVLDASAGDGGTDATVDVVPDALDDAPFDAGGDVAMDVVDDALLDTTVLDGPLDVGEDVDAGEVWVELGSGVWVSPARPSAGDTLRIRYEGALASAMEVVVHYGYNGWNEVAGTGATGQDDGTGNLDYFLDLPLSSNGSSHEGQILLPSGARSIHMVFRANQGGSEVWDNHDRRDYNLGVEFPYLGPFLTWEPTILPSEGLVVHFHTGMFCEGFVQVGAGSPTTLVKGTEGFMHHISLSGLAADTTYSYRVGCTGHAPSETFTFRTAPAGGSAVTFAVAADAQDNGETARWSDVAQEIEAKDPSFVVFAGDMAWNDKPGLWWTFFDKGRSLLAGRPLLAVPGNHDTPTLGSDSDTSSFAWLFGLDAAPTLARTLSWGPATFLLMSTETPDDFIKDQGSQYLWAQQQLSGLGAQPWVFASFHIPPYNAGARHTGQQGTFRDLTQGFDGTVDWVFSGHEHLYQRTKPMRYNGIIAPSGVYGRGSQDGVGYLITPPAGACPETQIVAWDGAIAHYRSRLAYPVPVAQQDTVASEQGFVIVHLQGKQITIRTYGVGTTVAPADVHMVDEVTYTKP